MDKQKKIIAKLKREIVQKDRFINYLRAKLKILGLPAPKELPIKQPRVRVRA